MKPYWLDDYEKDVKGLKLWQKVVSNVLKRLNRKKTTAEKIKDGNMTSEDPLENARLIEAKVKAVLENLGLELESCSITLDENHNDTISLQIRILPHAVKTPDEIEVDTKFNEIIKGLE